MIEYHWRGDVGNTQHLVRELLDEVADILQLDVCPMSWPVGMGGEIARPEFGVIHPPKAGGVALLLM